MRSIIGVFLIVSAGLASAADFPASFAQAKKSWEANKDRKEYQTYLAEFVQFNNSLKLDEKGGCYALSKGPIELMLVITHAAKAQYAVIERVLTNVDNAKSECFKKSYEGVRTKVPPYLPFIVQMGMGG